MFGAPTPSAVGTASQFAAPVNRNDKNADDGIAGLPVKVDTASAISEAGPPPTVLLALLGEMPPPPVAYVPAAVPLIEKQLAPPVAAGYS